MAPATQPLHSSPSRCRCTGTSSSLTMSEMTARPHLRVEPVAVEAEVLDLGLAEGHVGEPDATRDLGGVAPGEGEHLVVHVDPDYASLPADHLGSEEARLAAAGTKVEDGLARPQVPGRVTAAVVAGEHLLRNRREQGGIVRGRTAE